MLFRRRSKRPIDRVRDSARSAGQTARRAGRKTWSRVQSTQRDVARLMPARRARVERRKRVLFVLGGSAAGAALMALLDPVRGKARRALVRDQTAAFFRRRARRLGRVGRRVGSDFRGYRDRQAYGRSGEYIAPNDVTLEQKVESEVLGRSDVPKGSILINAEDGVIVLRGEVDTQDQIDHVESLVRKVDGVVEVENLLHLKGTPPPNKAAAWETR
jgi:hypothetical protein